MEKMNPFITRGVGGICILKAANIPCFPPTHYRYDTEWHHTLQSLSLFSQNIVQTKPDNYREIFVTLNIWVLLLADGQINKDLKSLVVFLLIT